MGEDILLVCIIVKSMNRNTEPSQEEIINNFFIKKLPDWITVHSHEKWSNSRLEIFKHSCLCPIDYTEKALKNHEWDFSIGDGNPSFIEYYDEEKRVTEYSRYGNDDGLEPIVITQDFPSIIEDSEPRVSEEFILFLNLYKDGNKLWAIDNSGDSEEAVRYSKNKIEIRKKYLMRFISAKQVALLLFIQSTRSTTKEYTDGPLRKTKTGELYTYSLVTGHRISSNKTASILLGKQIILPPARTESSERVYENFIYKEDSDGNPVEFSCEPYNHNTNKTSPGYLTPIYFKKSVLEKYYNNPNKYTISDGYLSCDSLWELPIDNDHKSTVMAFLGNLGKLPNKEQKYWRSFNIPPSDNSISRTNYVRSFLGEFCDTKSPEFEFKQLYYDFNNKWQNTHGWLLLRNGNIDSIESDLKNFRIPLSNEDDEFKRSLLLLSKLLNDRLDTNNIKKHISRQLNDEEKKFGSIKLLNIYLEENNIDTEFTEVLENIQLLRSKGVAHAEQSGYREALKTILGEKTRIQLITNMLLTINNFLRC